jgi:hypothetical protein
MYFIKNVNGMQGGSFWPQKSTRNFAMSQAAQGSQRFHGRIDLPPALKDWSSKGRESRQALQTHERGRIVS